MENMKSLADQLRKELVNPVPKTKTEKVSAAAQATKKIRGKPPDAAVMAAIQEFDNSQHKSMVHVRFDEKTVRLMNQFKMATGVDVTKLVAFSVSRLFETHPELKQIIKHFIQNSEL